jgi:PadR family transcriptional regulator PadR
LKALALEPLHGVGVSRRITQITVGAFRVSFGSLFPALNRMEQKSWVQAEWRASENNHRAKYYRLTSSGLAQLRAEERDWSQVVKIMTAAVYSEQYKNANVHIGRLVELLNRTPTGDPAPLRHDRDYNRRQGLPEVFGALGSRTPSTEFLIWTG